ncbi:uncharacterized protein LOC111639591 [Centruroides sculpturatus]|uniref:uncharacterized protein LOC111639591 n=1 Tax=Centruroides sculpturatus TaxID=218467 RepID=UPI000C6D8976|nr:uncharacterized protein LOC111639591 [Centruroides sculpturatus]
MTKSTIVVVKALVPALLKKKNEQFYKHEWEALPEFKGWLIQSKKGRQFALCKPCGKDINISNGKDALLKHSVGKFHIKKLETISSKQVSVMKTFAISGSRQEQLEASIKEGEIRLVAEHSLPFFVMEHLPKLIMNICPDSKIAQGLACSRIKTTAIMKYVTGNEGFFQVCDDLRNKKFYLIVDESMDRSTIKYLRLVVRYLKDDVTQDSFFGLLN